MNRMNRRAFLRTSTHAFISLGLAGLSLPLSAQEMKQIRFAKSGPFTRSTVAEIARRLAAAPYAASEAPLPAPLDSLTYDQYRDIRFRPDAAFWAKEGLPFQMQLFHRGFYFKDPVEIAVIDNGEAHHLAYDPSLFSFGPSLPGPIPAEDIGFSGLRLHGPINRPDYFDEVAVFQGASYFRSLGEGQVYGLSARGLALKTTEAGGEEFPVFRAFWVEKPAEGSETIVVHALLDSPSTTGAYRFSIRPGLPTLMDVEAQLYPRVALTHAGLAPGTSMFFFAGNDRDGIDDWRPQVHDSDGLLMITGRGERLWRPLTNPRDLQISAFLDQSPRGFGLIQRDRDFAHFQDLEAVYQRRPSLWVEPVGDWGAGAVTLVEIPTDAEIHDNIVAYWAPREPIPAGSEYSFAYRLMWGNDREAEPGQAIVKTTRLGRASINGPSPERRFVLDYIFPDGEAKAQASAAKATVTASKGAVHDIVVQDNLETGGLRLAFRLDPQNESLIELRAVLMPGPDLSAETWVYRWTA